MGSPFDALSRSWWGHGCISLREKMKVFGGGAGILSAAGLLSRLLHSCRQTVCKNSWPGCLGAEWRIKQEVDKEEEIERDRQ